MPFHQSGPNAIANIGTYIDINQSTDEIEILSRAQASRKDHQKRKKNGLCFEGTRVTIVGEMTDWVTNPGESRMYTLSGLAGIGKSTVAYTVATKVDKLGLLGASFFFTRDEIDCRTADKFFTTLVYQLCHYNEEIKNAIRAVLLTKDGAAAAKKGTPQEQLEALILDPLRGIAASRMQPILIVVDALDECDDDDVPSILEGLRRIVQDLPSFKIILTTRPKPFVNHYFATLKGHKIFHMQDIEDKVVNADIRLYLKHSLSHEQVVTYLQDPTEEWYASDAEIESLVHAAGKLFIIASTAVRFILDKHWSHPANRMKMILDAFAQNRTPFADLSHFYTTILRSVIPANCTDVYLVERYQIVVGIIVFIQVPVSIDTLASISGIDAKHISVVLRLLQSVIQVGADNIPIIYHKSFSDYITDQALCKDANLRIDPMVRNTWIVIRCFKMMNSHLQYNILHLDGPARFMDNKKGLAHQRISDEDLKEMISPGLCYTCIYWAYHLQGANIDDADLKNEIEQFASVQILPWFEVLSLIGKLDFAHRSICVALTLVKPTPSDLLRLLSDGSRFISKFYEVIERSALHTYYSGLPFTPTESLLYRRYSKLAADSIFRVVVGPEEWDALLTTQQHRNWENQEFYIKFSLDSALFASWGRNSLRFWDAATGTPISTISRNFSHAAIANDFSLFALAEGDTITLYSVKTSTLLATFATSNEILGLTLSSESSRLAALLWGGTVCLWDTGKSEPIASICGNSFDVDGDSILMFSPTGARLAYKGGDGIIQMRDGITGEPIANLELGANRLPLPHQLVFSHDGSLYAVLTDKALGLWKSEYGELVGISKVDGDQYRPPMLAISPNGSLLATAIGNKSTNGHILQLWSGDSENPPALIDELDLGSYAYIDSLTFSQNDILAFTNGSAITLYDVESRSVISTLPNPEYAQTLISRNGNRLAAMTDNGVVHLWDVQIIRTSSSLSTKEVKHIRAFALPQSCACLACIIFADDTIELLEMGATKQRISIQDDQDHDHWHVISTRFSPDGKKFAAACNNGTIKLWDSKDETLIKPIKFAPFGPNGQSVALSNRMLAAGGDALELWDLGTLHLIETVKHRNPCKLTFSDNGDLLAFSELEHRTLTVLDVMKHTTIATFEIEHFGLITNMGFTSDDSQLVVQFDLDFRSCNRHGCATFVLSPSSVTESNPDGLQVRAKFSDSVTPGQKEGERSDKRRLAIPGQDEGNRREQSGKYGSVTPRQEEGGRLDKRRPATSKQEEGERKEGSDKRNFPFQLRKFLKLPKFQLKR